MLQGVSNLEIWTISADTSPLDIIDVTDFTATTFTVESINSTAKKVNILEESGSHDFDINQNDGLVNHGLQLADWHIITVLNDNNETIHKEIKYTISGLKVITSLGNGEHEIVLVLSLIHI